MARRGRHFVVVAMVMSLATAGLLAPSPASAATPSIIATIPVEGPFLRAMALTPDGTQLFVTVSAAPARVVVINTTTNTVDDTIPVGEQPVDIVMSPDGKHAYVSNWASDSISVIDTESHAVVDTIVAGFAHPFRIAITPDGLKLFVVNHFGDSVSVVSTVTKDLIAQIPAQNTGQMGISANGKYVYVTDSRRPELLVIDTASDMVTSRIQLSFSPNCITSSPDSSRLYVTGSTVSGHHSKLHDLAVVNPSTGKVIGTIPVTEACSMVFSPAGSLAYIADSASNQVVIVDTKTRSIVNTVTAGETPLPIAISPDGRRVYVGTFSDMSVFVIDTAISTVTFNPNGGQGTMRPQESSAPAALTRNTFTRRGSAFAGWNTNADGTGTAYANRATYSFAADTTLYAQWR